MPTRITVAQLERAVGGAPDLLQLADRDRTGNLNSAGAQAFIREVMEEAFSEVNSYIGLAVDVTDPSLQTAPLLIRYELGVAAGLAWLRGAKGLAMPKNIGDEYERIMGELQKIAERKKGLGLPARAAASQIVQQVTKPDTEDFFSQRGPRRRFDGWS